MNTQRTGLRIDATRQYQHLSSVNVCVPTVYVSLVANSFNSRETPERETALILPPCPIKITARLCYSASKVLLHTVI